MIKPQIFKVDEDMIIYAFRYVLGRSTYAVAEMSSYIVNNKDILTPFAKKLIIKEIKEYYERVSQGLYMQCDKDCWDIVISELEKNK